jgi:putative Mg2+ transporter-C (MgtC) family protein
MVLREITVWAIIVRILTAILVGGVIGMERELKNRPAGMRTYMLVCVGSCLIMLTNQYLYQVTHTGDPMRLGAQVVSGIGFLGAGTIMVTKHNQIKGLTTAAGLWAAAGVGLALGVGFYEAALTVGFAVFFILTGLQKWDNKMRRSARSAEVYIEFKEDLSVGTLIRHIRGLNVEVRELQMERDEIREAGNRAMIATLHSKKRFRHEVLIADIRSIEGVTFIEEL